MSYESLGALLRHHRKRAGLSQSELAKRFERTQSWLAKIEHDDLIPELETIRELAVVLDADEMEYVGAYIIASHPSLFQTDPSWELVMSLAEETLKPEVEVAPELSWATALSRKDIEIKADKLNQHLFPVEYEHGRAIPLERYIPLEGEVQFNVDHMLPYPLRVTQSDGKHEGSARFDAERSCFHIELRKDLASRAMRGDGRARFTFAHEIGHVILHHKQLEKYQGSMYRDTLCTASERLKEGQRIYEHPEWQANAYAGALLVPTHGARRLVRYIRDHKTDPEVTATDVADTFKVSYQMANIRLSQLLPRLLSDD